MGSKRPQRKSSYPILLYIIALVFIVIIGYEVYILLRNTEYLQLPETISEHKQNSEGVSLELKDVKAELDSLRVEKKSLTEIEIDVNEEIKNPADNIECNIDERIGVNAVYSLITGGPGSTVEGSYWFEGTFSSVTDCKNACLARAECDIWSWHESSYEKKFAHQCFALTSAYNDGVWVAETGIISGRKTCASEQEVNSLDVEKAVPNVKHAFTWSPDKKFIVVDRYEVYVGGKQSLVILGDGTIPHKLDESRKKIIPLVSCVQGVHRVEATMSMIEGHMEVEKHYDNPQTGNPFSSNGDRFKTILLDCPLPIDPLTPIRLEGTENPDWSVEISHPIVPTASDDLPSEELSLAYCLCPVYGLKEGKWLIEWLEYHLALGISLIHVYLYASTPMMDKVFDIYKREKKIIVHDWSQEASGGYIGKSYERAKWAAQTDCLLRERGRNDFIVMTDVDEILRFPYLGIKPNVHPMQNALNWCYKKFEENRMKRGCSFNSHTITSIYTKLTPEELEFEEQSNGILLERYGWEESKPHCPYNCRCYDMKDPNCRMFHYGRQKYMVYIRDLSLPPVVLWTHAIKRNYGGDDVMSIFPDHKIHVRHYQGHWYLKKGRLAEIDEITSKLNEDVLQKVKERLKSHTEIKELYFQSSREHGIPWVKTQEREEKFHHWLPRKQD